MALILEDPDFALLSVKFLIENVFLRVSTRRNSKIFPAWGFYFLWFLRNGFLRVPCFRETSPSLKKLWLHACDDTYI